LENMLRVPCLVCPRIHKKKGGLNGLLQNLFKFLVA
jgi:hypothetical protein